MAEEMLLAARGLGLASVLTTRPRRGFEKEIKARLGIPDNVDTAVEDVTFDETWGQRWEAAPWKASATTTATVSAIA